MSVQNLLVSAVQLSVSPRKSRLFLSGLQLFPPKSVKFGADSIQSLVDDSTYDHNRGVAFWWLQVTGNIGTILGGLLSVLLTSTSFMGIAGWRISFHLVAIISVIVGILLGLFAKDPRFVDKSSTNGSSFAKSLLLEFKELFQPTKSVMKIPSFQIIVAHGVGGSFPWSALSFAPMWLELIGFTHK
ncbi:hypothetical protein C5167_046953 [Papaver somniferum]|uniref:Major facilitator superfamily (MFS) profile domain-containing protein n=1 Tax=Papaver somniferum TaxID=3469 RepID=A0A4Y7LG18_PAPSO|nr:hypothetical protein C5167_046953 [Papaver somniferum]